MKSPFELLKYGEYDLLYDLIYTNKLINLDIRDEHSNYFIHYCIILNQYKILELILELLKKNIINIRLDILDNDGRTILYNCIKYNYSEIIRLLIQYNKETIGISILDLKDILGYTALHYSIIFNNIYSFKLLLENNADPYIFTNDKNNSFMLIINYKNYDMINYLIEQKYNFNFITEHGETILQYAIEHNKDKIINLFISSNILNTINLDNKTYNIGLTILHKSIIYNKAILFQKLLTHNANVNLPDNYGNTPLHYIISEKRISYLDHLLEYNINFNIANIYGNLPLHLLLNNMNLKINDKHFIKFIIHTDLNLLNNNNETCFMKLIKLQNILIKYKHIIITKPLNIYIRDNKINNTILNILIESYYNQLIQHTNILQKSWEKKCIDNIDYCKQKIKKTILHDKRSIPRFIDKDLQIDKGIYTKVCSYTGNTIDILFGLLLIYNTYKNILVSIIIEFPLTINKELESYYKQISLDYPYKLNFSNIEIVWSYQKLFFPSYFDNILHNKLKNSHYIVIPIGIETSMGAHANILLWDVLNKVIERFEPNGANYPFEFNYNPLLLDTLLIDKFKLFEPHITYITPSQFLPPIGFQLKEILESNKLKYIGDPDGFCGVWCIWWVYQRLLNINNKKFNVYNIANGLISIIAIQNKSYKLLIRNFSRKITLLRDNCLKKYNLDINDWIIGNFNNLILLKLEKYILTLFIK